MRKGRKKARKMEEMYLVIVLLTKDRKGREGGGGRKKRGGNVDDRPTGDFPTPAATPVPRRGALPNSPLKSRWLYSRDLK